MKKKVKVKQKRGRKPTKVVKPTTVVKAILSDAAMVNTVIKDEKKIYIKTEQTSLAHEPFAAILNPEHTTIYNGSHPQVPQISVESMDL